MKDILTISNERKKLDFQSLLMPVDDLVADHTDTKSLAAVLVPLINDNNEWHMLLTRRSKNLRNHPGEVAFPGGMWEEGDDYLATTALRESEEEISLPRERVSVVGALESMCTRRMTEVKPIVGVIPSNLPLIANEDEIEAIFTVPLAFFHQDTRLRTDIFQRQDGAKTRSQWVPAYQFDDYEIWGFTAAVIVQLMNRCFSAELLRENRAPEKVW